jgi:hypothetical protein
MLTIPLRFLAGYSRNGKIIYIDRHMPEAMRYDGRNINTDRYLILHEEVEKTLIDQLGLHHLHAHQIASRAEQAAVRAAGIRWRDYDRFMQKYVKRIGDERLIKVPADLDLKPYRDEHDDDLVKRMLRSIEDKGPRPVSMPHSSSGDRAAHAASDAGRYQAAAQVAVAIRRADARVRATHQRRPPACRSLRMRPDRRRS